MDIYMNYLKEMKQRNKHDVKRGKTLLQMMATGHDQIPPNAASSSQEELSGYGILQENQEYYDGPKLYEEETKTLYNLSIYQININLPSPHAPLVLPPKFKTTRKESRASLSTILQVAASSSMTEMPRTFEEELSHLAKGVRDTEERRASDGQSYMVDGGCQIATHAKIIPVDTYKLMMTLHPTRPVVRSSTCLDPPATDYAMLWYLVRDEGCRPEKALKIVNYAFFAPVTDETQKFAASFNQSGYQSDNGLMNLSFEKRARYVDYYPNHALQQYWVSPILKEGIKIPEERSCAHLFYSSVCVCCREERVLNRIYRYKKHSDSFGVVNRFQDAEFKNLKGEVLGGKECTCPKVVTITV